ncbi:MAG TPA: FAD-dependent oxidoreductase [Bryobacteraceae bacterium]|jgi:protoporphyrinogen oxidase|nr:FAD-dependent oxidoreductase [Bryobacteraceae bacterium]
MDNNSKNLPSQHVVILGAGPAGVGAAYQLVKKGAARVTLLEQQDRVGGNAGSFNLEGVHCDYGSHRLHPVVAPEIMEDLRQLLGKDLLFQTRHGNILLKGRWIHFPLKPVDLLLRLPKSFAMSILGDLAGKILPREKNSGPETFATVLERGLGKTICREFYFPYARKLWGVAPEELAVTTAQRRVSGSSIGKMVLKVANQIPGMKPPTAGKFYYMRKGYGQISQCLADAAQAAGADIRFGARFTAIEREGGRIKSVRYQQGGQEFEIPTQHVWSTIPISILLRGMGSEVPAEVMKAATNVAFRGMILIYLVLDQDRFSGIDAYYFPEEAIPITRLSQPKLFSSATEPRGKTVLCAELPSDPGLPEWEMTDEQLGERLLGWMAQAGLPKPAGVLKVVTRRLRQAYPVYRRGYEERFDRMDQWLGEQEGVLTFGRQGLFAHDNTHHTLEMAYAAVGCFSPDGSFDRARWAEHRKKFETHVVED